MVLCGAQPVLFTNPAWSFGLRPGGVGGTRGGETAGPHSPGPGGFAARSMMGTSGPVFGPSSRGPSQAAEPYGEYTNPVSQGPRQPACTFGRAHQRGGLRDVKTSNPGPASYETACSSMTTSRAAGWGRPPRTFRPAAPATRPKLEDRPTPKARGPTFGLPCQSPHLDPTPGPQDYQCGCAGLCCKACDSFAGVSFKGRRPLFYGKISTITPGPAAYHTGCSTIGVASAICAADERRGARPPTYYTTAPQFQNTRINKMPRDRTSRS